MIVFAITEYSLLIDGETRTPERQVRVVYVPKCSFGRYRFAC